MASEPVLLSVTGKNEGYLSDCVFVVIKCRENPFNCFDMSNILEHTN